MKAYRGDRSMVPLILSFGRRYRCVVNFTPDSFDFDKESRHQLKRRLDESPSRCERSGEYSGLEPWTVQ